MNGKIYKIINAHNEKYLVVFPTGDVFFDMFEDLKYVFSGQNLNSKYYYRNIVISRKYKLKYAERTTTFIANNPELLFKAYND